MKQLLLLLLLFSLTVGKNVYMIGYVPPYRMGVIDQIDLTELTHVIAAFANPDSSGTLSCPIDLDYFSEKVLNAGSHPVVSIGGGGSYSWGADTTVYSHLYADTNRTMFVNNLVAYAQEFSMAGIDVDIEGTPLMNPGYNAFVQELADSLHAAGLEIYSAYGVGSYAGAGYADDATLQKFDIIGTMSYGGVDNWNWHSLKHPSTVDRFISDIQYFIDRGVDPSKIAGGVPFYSVGFPTEQQTNYSSYIHTLAQLYSDSFYIKQNPFYNDTLVNQDGMPEYTNSFTSMKQKIDHADSIGAGIMIWELGQDNFGDGPNMLDSMIAYIAGEDSSGTVSVQAPTGVKRTLFAAVQDRTLSLHIPAGTYRIVLSDLRGKQVAELAQESFTEGIQSIPLAQFGLAKGVYFVSIRGVGNASSSVSKIMVK